MLVRFHVPFDGAGHILLLGSEPESLTAEHAEDEDPGITFWALHGDTPTCSGCSRATTICRSAARC